MGDAIGQILPLAVVITISPIPIIGVVLMLSTPRGRSNGPAFLAGWILGLAAVGGAVLALSNGGGARSGGEPAGWVSGLEFLLGLVAAWLARNQWRKRPNGGEQELPSWMSSVERFTPMRSAGLGVTLSAANPKNLLLIVGGAAEIAQTGASAGSQVAALAIFVLIATVGPAVPVAASLALGERSEPMLARLKDWMSAHGNAIMTVLLLVIAAKLIGDAVSGWS